ncbi:MAG: hypothetical protein COA73_05070 [Candidatus Hydrogenedentota bacterium]|nr:MAG: hypothetical protein COA73_05070 [Candidatus Hydrogenedentota bacterium]
MILKKTILSMFLGLATLALSGCASNGSGWDVGIGGGIGGGGGSGGSHVGGGVHRSSGPPDHAPAHGYRKKHHNDDVELVFDSGLGVYKAVGFENTFYSGDYYYRDAGHRWETGSGIHGPWHEMKTKKLPHGLKNKHKEKKKHKKKKGRKY